MDVRIEFIYKTPKGLKTVFHSEEMSAEEALLFADDLERTGRVKTIVFLDQHDSSWTMKELKTYIKGIETEPHQVTVFFDGGFHLESKNSGLGCAIYFEQNGKSFRIRKNAQVKELQSNNEAEYAAIHLALGELEQLGVHHQSVQFVGDSQVVINQLKGEWACFEEELTSWANRVDKKMEQLGIQPVYELVSRNQNQESDKLATQALNGVEISSMTEVKGRDLI